MADKISAPLLSAAFEYVQGKRTFETTITAARHAGWSDEDIARVTGLTVPMIQAVAGESRAEAPASS